MSTGAGGVIDVEFRGVSKRYGEVLAVDSIDLVIRRGEFVSFLGPSGCGKTTSLRMIAGFDDPTAGDVLIGGKSVVGVPAFKRPVNMVFQHYALFPHLTVGDNIAYGLKQVSPRPAKEEIRRRTGEALELVRLVGYEKRRIWELSGGQQQRVALARALINQPTVLLLDEPLAALDRKLRREMQMELQTLQREVGITFILVTHDQEEALSMSDSIAIMREGRIIQMGTARTLYDAPIDRYVADFVGESNFFRGAVDAADASSATIQLDNGIKLVAPFSASAQPLGTGESGILAVRPEVISLWSASTAPAEGIDFTASGTVTNRIYLGDQTEYRIVTEQLGEVLVRAGKATEAVQGSFETGDAVRIGWSRNAGLALAGE